MIDNWHEELKRLVMLREEKERLEQLESFIGRIKSIENAPEKRQDRWREAFAPIRHEE